MVLLYVFSNVALLFIIYKFEFLLIGKGTVGYKFIAIIIPLPFAIFNLQAFQSFYIPFFNIDTRDNDFLFYLSAVLGYSYCLPYIICCRRFDE